MGTARVKKEDAKMNSAEKCCRLIELYFFFARDGMNPLVKPDGTHAHISFRTVQQPYFMR